VVEVASPITTSLSTSSVDSGKMPEKKMDGIVGSTWAFECVSTVSGLLGYVGVEVITSMRPFPPMSVIDGVVSAISMAGAGEGWAVSEEVAMLSRMIFVHGAMSSMSSADCSVSSAPEDGFAGTGVVVSETCEALACEALAYGAIRVDVTLEK
jgi:hypothetical protein